MKAKTLTFLTLLFLVWGNSFAQDLPCGTIDSLQSNQNLRTTSTQQVVVGSTVCVNVHFHIVRQTNGSGGFNQANLSGIIDVLNAEFNEFGIFINNAGYDYINNSEYYDLVDLEFDDLLEQNSNTNAVNFYLVETAPWRGRAYRPSNTLVVRNQDAITDTSPHELGHCFGLKHTHAGNPFEENIERTGSNANCDSAADGFCDTPADPNLLNNKVNSACEYIAGETHPVSGLPYAPDVTNIMSYAPDHCRNTFSNEQGQAMFDNIHNHPALQPTISSTCSLPSVTGDGTICNNDTESYTFNYSSDPDFWIVSNNLIKVSSNGSSVTVKRKSGELGSGTVTARINGFDVIKNVQLQITPSIGNYNIQGLPSQTGYYSSAQASVSVATGATQYEWTIVDDYNSCGGNYNGPVFWEYNNSTQVTTPSRYIGINFGYCQGTFRVRCRAISNCGFKYYTDWVVTVGSSPCGGTLSIYPNPSSSEVTLQKIAPPGPCLQSETDAKLAYQLYDDQGNLIWEKTNGKQTEKLDMRSYKKGRYYIHAISGNSRIVEQLIKE